MTSINAETIFNIGPLPITNSLISASTVTLVLVIIALLYSKYSSIIPNRFTAFIEWIVEYIYSSVEGIAGKKARIFFSLAGVFFIFIITNSWFALLPFVGPIGIKEVINGHEEFIPIFRSINADLNGTIVLSLVSVVMTHFFAIRSVGIYHHIARYFPFIAIRFKDLKNFKKIGALIGNTFINTFVAFLELVSEFVKIISLSFRLFGNIFAGEVVLGTISSLVAFSAFLIPLPFMGLEIIVGYVQATVFTLLTVVFMNILTEKHGAEELETH